MAEKTTHRREQIVAAARDAFTSLGYDGTTIGNIAADLNISKAAIAYYFPTKDTFLDEFLPPFLDELEASAREKRSPSESLSGYLWALTHHLDVAVWMDTDPVLQGHPVHGRRLERINKRITNIITGGSRKRLEQVKALGVLGGVWRPARELTASELTSHHDEIVEVALASY